MKIEKCPSCNTVVSIMDEVCPKCGELLFHETIEVESIVDVKKSDDIQKEEDNLEEDRLDENNKENELEEDNLTKVSSFQKIKNKILKFKKHSFRKLEKVEKLSLPMLSKFKKSCLRVFKKLKNISVMKAIARLGKKIYVWLKDEAVLFVKKTHIYKMEAFCTYINVLGVLILFFTAMTIFAGIELVKYKDSSSALSKVTSNTSYEEVRKENEKKEFKQRLDIERRVVIDRYEEVLGGVKCTVDYERSPSSEVITQTVITFEHNDKNVRKMRKYLEYNYGIGKVLEDGTLMYDTNDMRYTFTNGTSAKTEKVKIVYS